MPKVAISDDFLVAFSKLPREQQKKVREFTEKFRLDPTAASINYEPLVNVKDKKVRSVRIGKEYRAIVLHPPEGDVYICVWVDHHDEAMDWARDRRFDINPVLGSLQVYQVKEEAERQPAAPNIDTHLLAGVSDDDLRLAGVPDLLLPSVRALRFDTDLDALAPYLPREAADVLYLLAAGMTMAEALEEMARAPQPAPKVDTGDFQKALEHPESRRHFKVIETEKELAEILNAPLALWRIFLHPSQAKLVRMEAKGPVQVLGGAGTGKTVVLMHRARYLAAEVFKGPDDRILVTTFTRNLAADLRHQLQSLCGPEFARLEIVNLHKWAVDFMRKQGVKFNIADKNAVRGCWDEAYAAAALESDFPIGLYKDEWKHVVQGGSITSRDEYLVAPRTGRGTSLVRRQRLQIWQVFEAYRTALQEKGKVEQADVIRETRLFVEKNPALLPYRAVLADEVQDFSLAELRLLRALVQPGRNDLFVVGDAHQRIYGAKASLGKAGIEVRGRSRRLHVNYRTTEKIRNWAVALLTGVSVDDINDGVDTLKGYRSLRPGVVPEVRHFSTSADEASFVAGKLKEWLGEQVPAEEICVCAHTHSVLQNRVRRVLEQAGIPFVEVDADSDESNLGAGVRIATMHRMKGLEFPRVLLCAVEAGVLPYPLTDEQIGDTVSQQDHEVQEKSLLYVAATRARDELVVTGAGVPCPWLEQGIGSVVASSK
ncbi:MAG: UvrD-helicase domain-containing protein [Candidatus Xenobia bacterium]